MDRKSGRRFRVVVLAGGESAEREVSLTSGAGAAAALRAAGHATDLIDPAATDLDGIDWGRLDGCFLALHGGVGENGRIQKQLDRRRIPFTGSNSTASRLAMSKSAAKVRFRRAGVPTPEYVLLDPRQSPQRMVAQVARLGFPVVVKPDAQGSSLGVGIAQSRRELPARVAQSGRFGWPVIAEQRIIGREFTVSILGRKPLPPLEVVGCEEIFDYDSKYSSTLVEYHFDAGLTPIKLKQFQTIATAAAATLGTSGLVRVDLMLDRADRPWVLEVNTLPGLTEHSLAPKAAARVGMNMPELCDWMLRDGLRRKSG